MINWFCRMPKILIFVLHIKAVVPPEPGWFPPGERGLPSGCKPVSASSAQLDCQTNLVLELFRPRYNEWMNGGYFGARVNTEVATY